MEKIAWLLIMIPLSALFTGIGIYAWRRKEPMWFFAGMKTEENKISDVAAYNRANGILWLVYSLFMWIAAAVGAVNGKAGGMILMAVCILGALVLPVVYTQILRKYGK